MAHPFVEATIRSWFVVLAMLVCASPTAAQAQADTATGQKDLAKALSNPVADLVSIPFQFNWENGVGPAEDLRFVLNIQPVVPFKLSDSWNLIGRFIVPFVSQPALTTGGSPVFGTGDIILSTFFSPTRSKLIWGIGPVFALPTTTDPRLGTGKWSAGPTAVVLKQAGSLTVGALVNHLWSFANTGDVERIDVNQTLLQPFLAHSSGGGLTVGVSSEASANWEAESGEEWTIPVFFNLSKITKLGPFPFSVGGSVGVFVEKPTGGPDWKLRTTFTLILPRGK